MSYAKSPDELMKCSTNSECSDIIEVNISRAPREDVGPGALLK